MRPPRRRLRGYPASPACWGGSRSAHSPESHSPGCGISGRRIHTLVAIRCLDEGINIPSINTALILSSNDNYREFVQRRGRILRKYLGKTEAHIIDVIVLPSMDCKGIAEIEFRRFYEYAKLATNKDSLFKTLDMYMNTYDLSMKDISFKNDYVEEAILDE